MMEFAEARKAALVLAAIAEPTRLSIVNHLIRGPLHVSALAELVGAPMVNMSHHLGVMRQAGLLDDEKDGRRVVYKFRDGVLTEGDGKKVLAILNLGPFRVVIQASDFPPDAGSKPKAKSKSKPK